LGTGDRTLLFERAMLMDWPEMQKVLHHVQQAEKTCS